MKNIIAMSALVIAALAGTGCGAMKQIVSPSPLAQQPNAIVQPTAPTAAAPAAVTIQAVKPTSSAPIQTALPAAAPTVAPAAAPFTDHPWKWEHPGAAPFAKARAEAMQNREEAIRKLGFPEKCVAPLAEEMKKPGEKVTMKMGDRFAAQISKGGVVHGLAEGGGIVAFKKPMLKGMQLSAEAEKWTVTCEGQVQTILLPEVCFNFTAGIPSPAPAPAPQKEKQLQPIVPAGACPNGWKIDVYAWSLDSPNMPDDLRKLIEGDIATADVRESQEGELLEAYKTDAVSRTRGPRLLREVKIPAAVNADILIRHVDRDPVTKKLGQKHIVTLKMVNGKGTVVFNDDPRGHDAIGFIFPTEGYISPALSGPPSQLVRRIRIHDAELAKCYIFVSAIVSRGIR